MFFCSSKTIRQLASLKPAIFPDDCEPALLTVYVFSISFNLKTPRTKCLFESFFLKIELAFAKNLLLKFIEKYSSSAGIKKT